MAQTNSDHVFICYAHADKPWRDAFETMLEPACRAGRINIWSDAKIASGADWSQSIEQALARARVALLLVSPHFLKSEFINTVELTRLLTAAQTTGVAIRWVPISASLFAYSPLGRIQSAWDPKRPLASMSEAEWNGAIQQICAQIVEDFGTVKVGKGRRESLPSQIQSRLGDKYEIGEEIGGGQFSICYRAKSKGSSRTVGVKVFVASELDDWARQTFLENVQRAVTLTTPAFIRILDSYVDEPPEFLVSEFVEGDPLSKGLLRYPNGTPLAKAKSILVDLATAVEEIHRNGWLRGEFCSSNVLIERNGTARLSPVTFSNVLSELARFGGNLVMDRESLAYMTPEHFFGHQRTERTDQYSLGLIATELLGGEQIPRVTSPSDLESKRELFKDLESGKGAWARRSAEFVGVVSRMLRVDPAGRWPSMRDVRHYLQEIEVAESTEEMHRTAARASYLRLQSRGIDGERALFQRFYANLFASCPDVEQHFRSIDMDRQYAVLNGAVHLLLEFHPASERECAALKDLATRHAAFGLTRRHYELFLDALVQAVAATAATDATEIEAWRQTLGPGIEFICTCAAETPAATPPIARTTSRHR